MIKILLVEDHQIVRQLLTAHFDAQADISVIGQAGNGKIAFELLQQGLRPDVIITDLQMPVMDGRTLIKQIKTSELASISILILTMNDSPVLRQEAIRAGASAYLLKTDDIDDVVHCIRHTAAAARGTYDPQMRQSRCE